MIYFLIFTFLFCIFVEYYVGSILLRLDSTNNYTINIVSMLNFLIHPLHNSFLWNPELLIVNYPFMISIIIFINLIFNYNFNLSQNGFSKRNDSTTPPSSFT